MGQITSLFVRKAVSIVENKIDVAALLRSVGIEPDSPVDPSHMISDNEYYAFLERIARAEDNGTTLPLRAGAAMRSNDYGAFGLAWKSAPNLRGSFDRSERYARVLTSVSTYEVEATESGALMHLHREGERHLGMRISNEATIASIATISREVASKPLKPLAVYFKHPAPKSIADHEAYFGCPVHFDTDRDALLISHESLQTPNKLADEGISTFFESHLQSEVSKLEDVPSLERQVRSEVSQSLSEGIPTLPDIANRLGMSGRTLQRRLSEHGHSYQNLVDESRRQLAKNLLKDTDFSLVEVAFLTGFSEQSAFTRAFKRWAGQTPRSFRIATQSKS